MYILYKHIYTVSPRSSYPFYIINYYTKLDIFVLRNYMDNVWHYSCEMNFYPCTHK